MGILQALGKKEVGEKITTLERAVGETEPSGSCESQTVKGMFREGGPLEGLWRTEGQSEVLYGSYMTPNKKALRWISIALGVEGA